MLRVLVFALALFWYQQAAAEPMVQYSLKKMSKDDCAYLSHQAQHAVVKMKEMNQRNRGLRNKSSNEKDPKKRQTIGKKMIDTLSFFDNNARRFSFLSNGYNAFCKR